MRLKNFLDILGSSAFRNCRRYSSIEIPKRVKRDNLSILKALSSVTKPDYMAPQYHFIDDPYLIPFSSIDKREFSLSYVSGKNAARFVMEKYPKLFEYSTAHPEIKDFMPPSGPSTPLDTIEGLKERICMKLPIHSYDSYMKLFEEGIKIPRDVLDDLLDLLCFTNHEALSPPVDLIEFYLQDELVKQMPEQRIKRQSDDETEEPPEDDIPLESKSDFKKWKTNGAAETVFSQIKDPSSRNICSLIKGMIKFAAYEEAFDRYLAGLEQNVDFDVSTYNAIIFGMNHLSVTPEECMNKIVEVLKTMDSKSVMPNVGTFNNVLIALQDKRHFLENVQERMRGILSEMNRCGIEPSLATWFYVLMIAYPNQNVKSNILPVIIEKLGCSNMTIREPNDLEFFEKAMTICVKNFRSVGMAKSLNALVIGNEHVIGNSRNATSYYSNYLVTLGRYGSMEEFFDEYHRLSPHIYSPSFKVFETMLDVIADFGCYEHLPKAWSDMTLLRYSKRPDLLEKFLDILGKINVDDKLQLALVSIVDAIMKNFYDAKIYRIGKYIPMSGSILSNMVCVYLNANEVDKCWEAIKFWKEDEALVSTIPNEISLMRSCQAFIKRNEYERVHDILKMVTTYGYFCAEELLEEAFSLMTLSDSQK